MSQDAVPKEDLLEALYLEFVNRVNEVGVDINQVLSFPYTAPLLQFVCGLGPRKASQIIKVETFCLLCYLVCHMLCLRAVFTCVSLFFSCADIYIHVSCVCLTLQA